MPVDDVLPLEEEFPELGDMLKKVVEINSRFPKKNSPILIDGNQVFLKDKQIISDVKMPGRNDTCLCGSGKKFKKCCAGE